jgi:hypothetical protein
VYDLSQGMARQMSQMLIGKYIDGIWHTGICVYGYEYFYGQGIQQGSPGQTPFGFPHQIIELGETSREQPDFHAFLEGIKSRFNMYTYHLLENNCNDFTKECAVFLTGRPIPDHISGLPAEVMATPFGAMIRPLIDGMFSGQRGAPDAWMTQQPQQQPLAAGPSTSFSGQGRTLLPGATSPSAPSSPIQNSPIVFRTANLDGLFGKLYPLLRNHVSIEQLRELENFLRSPTHDPLLLRSSHLMYVTYLLDECIPVLSQSEQFPVWDLLRLLVLHAPFAEMLVHNFSARLHAVASSLLNHTQTVDKPYALTSLRLLVNVIQNYPSFVQNAAYSTPQQVHDMVQLAAEAIHANPPFLRLAASALANNLIIYSTPEVRVEAGIELMSALVHWVGEEANNETVLYMLRAIQMIVNLDPTAKDLAAALDFNPARFLDRGRYTEEIGLLASQIQM